MKVINKTFLVLSILLALTLAVGSLNSAIAQEKMSVDEYKAQLAEWQAREANAKKAGLDCTTEVADLKGDLESTQSEIDGIWKDILSEIGATQSEVDAFRSDLKRLDSRVGGLLYLSPEELFKRRDEVAAVEEELAASKKNRISALTEMQNLLATTEGKISQIKNKMPQAVFDEYTVVMGDYLWKISGKSDIYSDPIQWMRIYSYNKDQIKDADLIYPEQIFKIQREVGPDEYLVAKGDYLSKIAGNAEVLGDPTQWAKIYEKNKDVIGEDANSIFPHTVLVVPRD